MFSSKVMHIAYQLYLLVRYLRMFNGRFPPPKKTTFFHHPRRQGMVATVRTAQMALMFASGHQELFVVIYLDDSR